jgi:hypothetical protein
MGGMKKPGGYGRRPGFRDKFARLASSASGRPPERIRHCGEHNGALPSVGEAEAASASFRRSTHKRCRPNDDTR